VNGWSGRRALAVAVLCATASPLSAHAEDFFSALFGAIGRGLQLPPVQSPLPDDGSSQGDVPRPRVSLGGPAWCVRTCDGRYFPLPSSDQNRATSCNNFCPAAQTKVVYGSAIDNAATEDGKLYSQLPNAFRYRNELVAGCTCNGRDPAGLASIPIEDDPTLRKGDLIAGPRGGLAAANGDAAGPASLGSTAGSDAVRAR
jgi:Protein of unknown function (DUF2865)